MLCPKCDSGRIIWEDGGDYCWDCQENVTPITLKELVKRHLDDAKSAFIGCDIYGEHCICLRYETTIAKDFKLPSEGGDMVMLHILTHWLRLGDSWFKPTEKDVKQAAYMEKENHVTQPETTL